MLMHELPFETATPGERRLRALAVLLLRLASRGFGLLAERVALREAPLLHEPVIEFHGDAGAPEGALYVNGQLVGQVLGVTRL